MLIQFPLLFRLLGGGFRAMAVYPFIFIRDKAECTPEMLQHERIHLKQQLELAILPFYLIYSIEYLWHYLNRRNRMQAYYHISFEQEAYTFEKDRSYLKNRRTFAMWRKN